MSETSFSHDGWDNEHLVAYLDDELDLTKTRELETALENDVQLRNRLEQLTLDKDVIVDAFAPLLKHAPGMPVTKVPISTNIIGWQRRLAPVAVALIVAFVGGWGSAQFTATPALQSWQSYAAAYHALYVEDTLAAVQQSDEDANKELTNVSNAVGASFNLATLRGFEGLRYKRAQILGFEGSPLAQLTFLSQDGSPIALCVIRADGKADSLNEVARMEGMSTAGWHANGFEYLLIGGTNDLSIQNWSNAMKVRL